MKPLAFVRNRLPMQVLYSNWLTFFAFKRDQNIFIGIIRNIWTRPFWILVTSHKVTFSFKNFFSRSVVHADGKTSAAKLESLPATIFVWHGITQSCSSSPLLSCCTSFSALITILCSYKHFTFQLRSARRLIYPAGHQK